MHDDQQAYEFISYPYNCEYGSSVNTLKRHIILDRDIDLGDMLEEMTTFLRSCGYVIPTDSYLELVDGG